MYCTIYVLIITVQYVPLHSLSNTLTDTSISTSRNTLIHDQIHYHTLIRVGQDWPKRGMETHGAIIFGGHLKTLGLVSVWSI